MNKLQTFLDFLFLRIDLRSDKKEIESFIRGCEQTNIRFEKLSPLCAGISTPNECIISETILSFPKPVLLYILFHEISHQYQYKKHGSDMMLDVYTKMPFDDAINKLIYAESVADRLAILRLRKFINHSEIPPYRYYRSDNQNSIKTHLKWIRTFSDGLTIDEINERIYEKYFLI